MISVLYVDDDESFCGFFKLYLEKMDGFTVTTVRFSREAVDMILTGAYDIVVSDYHMPGMTGIDLLRTYREKGSTVPFILFTGKGREEVVIEAINNGAAFYLQKGGDTPSLFAELAHKIKQTVKTEESQRQLLESEEKFRLLFETARDGIILLSDWRICDCNNQAALLFNTDRNHLMGLDFVQLAPEVQPDGIATRKKAESNFETAFLDGGVFMTWKFRRFDTTVFDAEMSISRLDIRGTVQYQAIIRDITERIQAENELEQRNIDMISAYEELIASGDELRLRVEELRESQEQLRESEKRYKDLADLLPEGIFECSLDGNITYANRQAYMMFGYDPERSFEGLFIFNFLVLEDRERAIEAASSVVKGDPSRPNEYLGLRPDGSTFPVIIHSSLVLRNGAITGVRGVIIDISARKKAEDALRESKQQLVDVIEFFPDATMIINNQGEVLFWNRAMVKMTGIDAEDMLGKDDYEHALPFYGVRRPILVDLALAPDLADEDRYFNVRHEGEVIVGEAYMPGLGEGTTFLWGVASPLRNARGEIVGAIECVRDITDRKEAEDALKRSREELEELVAARTDELVQVNYALRESEEQYRTLVEFSPDAIFVHDGKQVLYLNPAGMHLFGAEKEDEVLGHKILDYVHPDYHSPVKSRVDNSLSGTLSNPPEEKVFIGVSGENIPVEVSTMLIRYLGKPGILVVARDISSRKEAEKQLHEYAKALEDKNQELDFLANRLVVMNRDLDDRVKERTAKINRLLRQKDDFVNQLGHDLKTPLTPLVALLPGLMREEPDQQKRDLYGVLLRSAYSIREQIEKILILARFNRHDGPAEYELIKPATVLTQAIDKNWLFIEQKELTVEMEIPDDLAIRFSNQDASSVFDNLISNAIKYTPHQGKVKVYAKANDEVMTITVEDNGIGLTQEEILHVFDEFYMADRSRHDRQSSGLGLAIVRRIMEFYGGTVWAESDGPGTGSRFTVSLPFTRAGGSDGAP